MRDVAAGSPERRVLVTGASGFIGRHVLAPLRRRGFAVHAVSRRLPVAAPSTGRPVGASRRSGVDAPPGRALVWHAADLLRPGIPKALVERLAPTHLLHLAWEATPGRFWSSPDNARWLEASLALVDAFRDRAGRRLVGVGSGAEYDWRRGRCDEATTPLRPTTAYSESKDAFRRALAERAGLAAGHSGDGPGPSWAWARLFWQFGPGEARGRLVPSVIEALLEGRPAECSSGVQRRDFLYVADVGEALAALLESDVEGCVNIGAGRALAVGDLAQRVAQAVGRPADLRLGARADSANEPPRVEAATQRLREEVGFEPKWPLDDAIEATVAWWRAERAARHHEQEAGPA